LVFAHAKINSPSHQKLFVKTQESRTEIGAAGNFCFEKTVRDQSNEGATVKWISSMHSETFW
jgi:hypothetical protein